MSVYCTNKHQTINLTKYNACKREHVKNQCSRGYCIWLGEGVKYDLGIAIFIFLVKVALKDRERGKSFSNTVCVFLNLIHLVCENKNTHKQCLTFETHGIFRLCHLLFVLELLMEWC